MNNIQFHFFSSGCGFIIWYAGVLKQSNRFKNIYISRGIVILQKQCNNRWVATIEYPSCNGLKLDQIAAHK